jgi:hypothetical protein
VAVSDPLLGVLEVFVAKNNDLNVWIASLTAELRSV